MTRDISAFGILPVLTDGWLPLLRRTEEPVLCSRRRNPTSPLTPILPSVVEARRVGWWRLKLLLEREGIRVCHKKLSRLQAKELLQVRRRGRKRALGTRAPLMLPQRPSRRWSRDFAAFALTVGWRFRILVVVDDCTRELPVPDRQHIVVPRTG